MLGWVDGLKESLVPCWAGWRQQGMAGIYSFEHII